ncbi:MAG TPA: Wzz/FepE/Etk N-terminal domain-containing protein [Gemmataceae bacterium]|nr:Wzz/FepE/Etk N-terminal domain-containing protein [Gemmataceae bacterium]
MSKPVPDAAESGASAPAASDSWISLGWRRKGLIFVCVCAGIVVSGFIGFSLPRTYQSTAQLSIIKKPVSGIEARPMEENVTPPQDLLKSPMLIDRAIQTKDLSKLACTRRADVDAVDAIKQDLAVTATRGPMGQTTVYRMSFRARDPEESKEVLLAMIDAFKEFTDKKHQSVTEATFEQIMKEKELIGKELAAKEAGYREFREKAPLMSRGKDGIELRQQRLNSIQTKRSALLLQRVELEGQIKSIEAGLKEGRSQEAMLAMLGEFARKTDPTETPRERGPSVQDQLLPLMLEERKLSQTHGAKHPEVVAVRKKIEVASKLLVLPPTAWSGALNPDGAGKATIDPVNLQLQVLKQKLENNKVSEELLARVFQVEQEEARRLSFYEIENDSYQTGIALNQKLYEALAKRLNEISLVRSAGGYQIDLLETPTVGKKVAPSMALALLIGAMAGMTLGFGLGRLADVRARAEPKFDKVSGQAGRFHLPTSSTFELELANGEAS